jgi:serine/threonine-protein kinase
MTYEMLTGEQPYVGEAPMQIAYQHANDSVPAPSSRVPSTPRELDELVLWATARDPEERPRDAKAMLDQLLDVEHLVRPSGDASATTAQQTMVMPRAFNAAADADTQILGAQPLASLVAHDSQEPDSSTQLTTLSQKRKRRGYWLFALVILLAALAGGTGWYFGAGPGSQVPIPSFTAATPEAASARLTALGLTPKLGQEFSSTIAPGLVTSTQPGSGARVAKGSVVVVNVSQGPQPITLPALAGLSTDAATAAITDSHAVVGSTDSQFNDTAAEGTVIAASRESDGSDISAGGDYFEGLKVNLVVSLGAIPDVTGESVDKAIATLAEKGLVGQRGAESYSDTVDEGDVISIAPAKEGPVRSGDAIVLEVSRGPEPVTIPNVVGMPWNDAKRTLTDLGFKLSYNPAADAFSAVVKVASTNPAAGLTVEKGSTISLVPTNPLAF